MFSDVLSYGEWKLRVDCEVLRHAFVTTVDLPYDYQDAYGQGVDPVEVGRTALQDNGYQLKSDKPKPRRASRRTPQ